MPGGAGADRFGRRRSRHHAAAQGPAPRDSRSRHHCRPPGPRAERRYHRASSQDRLFHAWRQAQSVARDERLAQGRRGAAHGRRPRCSRRRHLRAAGRRPDQANGGQGRLHRRAGAPGRHRDGRSALEQQDRAGGEAGGDAAAGLPAGDRSRRPQGRGQADRSHRQADRGRPVAGLRTERRAARNGAGGPGRNPPEGRGR